MGRSLQNPVFYGEVPLNLIVNSFFDDKALRNSILDLDISLSLWMNLSHRMEKS